MMRRRSLYCRRLACLVSFFGLAVVPFRLQADEATSKTEPHVTTPCWQEVAKPLGVDFQHRHFGQGNKYMPENMGAGVALFDADGDGRLDIYLVQGAPLQAPSSSPESEPAKSTGQDAQPSVTRNTLFLQQDGGRFNDATHASGLGDEGYGMGVTLGDIEGDGDLDVYVTNFGPDVLFRNRGDGTFDNHTRGAGLGLDGWSTGAAFLDLEGDGDLDLFVSRYLSYDLVGSKWCGNARRKLRSYCHPDVYSGASDVLYRNRGDGTFEDISRLAGLQSPHQAKGLGVLTYDLDADGHQDIFVANDSTMNFFYRGDSTGKLRQDALLSGLGFNASGAAEASMGIAYGDVDGDGLGEIFLTHLDQETNTLYRPLGDLFEDHTRRAGLDRASLPWVGFGTVMLDFDHDGDLDLFVGNGHIIDNIALFDSSRSHRQPAQLFVNNGKGRFHDGSALLGLTDPLVVRGVASGDLDNDGDVDLVLTQNGDRALVLRNGCADDVPALGVRLVGRPGNTQALGAKVELHQSGAHQARYVTGGGSYLSQSSGVLHFGLGTGNPDAGWRLTVHWPDGHTSTYPNLRPSAVYEAIEGQSPKDFPDLERRPF